MSKVLTLLLCHTSNTLVANIINWWQQKTPIGDNILIAFGGNEKDYQDIAWKHKVFVDDPQLRTQDHQREKQSYQGVFKAAAHWTSIDQYEYIHFAEYDHLPLNQNLHKDYISLLNKKNADVLGHNLRRIDSTNNPHLLYHLNDPKFVPFWKSISKRTNTGELYSFLGTGHFWKQRAFLDVAKLSASPPIYLELFMPSAAHHLGYEIAGFDPDHHYISPREDQTHRLDTAMKNDIWTIHPIKQIIK